MFKSLFSNLKKHSQNDEFLTQRRFPRRENDACICVINGQPYPVENWSLGGVLINADSKKFSLEDEMRLIIKFRVKDGVLDIPVRGTIVRKTRNQIAFEFKPLSKAALKKFQMVFQNHTRR